MYKKKKELYSGKKKENYKKKNQKLLLSAVFVWDKFQILQTILLRVERLHILCVVSVNFAVMETGNTKCPMCRAHYIKNPVARDVEMTVYEKGDKMKKYKSKYKEDNMTPKERRKIPKKWGTL